MSQRGELPEAPLSGVASGQRPGRRTDLSIRDLASELQAAVSEAEDLEGAEIDARMLGQLCARLEPLLNVMPNRFSRVKQGMLARMWRRHPAISLELLRGGTFVDFGCGCVNPFSSLLVLQAAGAGRCIGIDADPLQERMAVRALARTAMELIAAPGLYLPAAISGEQVRSNLAGLDIAAMVEGPLEGRVEALGDFPIEYRRSWADATGLDDASVHGISSISFLEHVADPEAVVAEMARVSRAGAIGVHLIDGADHRSHARPDIGPLAFLNDESDEAIVFGCNRVRPLDFVGIFDKHGFVVLGHEVSRREPVSESQRAGMVEPFRSMPIERLRAVGVRFAVRKT